VKKSNRGGYSGASWKHIEKIISRGRSRGTVFEDWLDFMLTSHLSATDNLQRGNTDIEKWDGEHEAHYLVIVGRYATDDPKGRRPIDYFKKAFHALTHEIEESGEDCLGEIYMMEITYGEHGQYFTPEAMTDMMASIIAAPSKDEPGAEVVCDPSCGSGRTLLSAHKTNPDARLVGVDLDARCAKMFALNLIFRGRSGDAYHGDSLAAKMYTVWIVRGGWVSMQEVPEMPNRIQEYAREQGRLFDTV